MKIRIEIEVTDGEVECFRGYYAEQFGERPHGVKTRIRDDLTRAVETRVSLWRDTQHPAAVGCAEGEERLM